MWTIQRYHFWIKFLLGHGKLSESWFNNQAQINFSYIQMHMDARNGKRKKSTQSLKCNTQFIIIVLIIIQTQQAAILNWIFELQFLITTLSDYHWICNLLFRLDITNNLIFLLYSVLKNEKYKRFFFEKKCLFKWIILICAIKTQSMKMPHRISIKFLFEVKTYTSRNLNIPYYWATKPLSQ